MKYGVLAFLGTALVAPAADAQGLWWVEGDRYCSDFGKRTNGAMCGNPRKGESEPKPTYRYEFTTPRIPVLEDEQARQGTIPVPNERPAAAPTRQQAPARQQPRR